MDDGGWRRWIVIQRERWRVGSRESGVGSGSRVGSIAPPCFGNNHRPFPGGGKWRVRNGGGRRENEDWVLGGHGLLLSRSVNMCSTYIIPHFARACDIYFPQFSCSSKVPTNAETNKRMGKCRANSFGRTMPTGAPARGNVPVTNLCSILLYHMMPDFVTSLCLSWWKFVEF